MQADKPMEATLEQGQPNHRDFGNLKEFKVQHSTLRDDPFAIRPGKTLLWTGVSMTLQPSKKKEEPRALLKNVWGEVPAGKVTAILGPSGAGKTSLLNILAGRTISSSNLTVTHNVRVDTFQVDPARQSMRRQIAFVAQEDSLPAATTPREAIRFSARLRLSKDTTDEELETLTNRMLQELGLEAAADTIVGNALIKGISGGERKRASVGVELVTRPALVFLDEPTSGLDSFAAVKLVNLLKKVASAGSSVLFTVHQPASETFASLDQVIFMAHGQVVYQGSPEKVPEYMEDRNKSVPEHANPADWMLMVTQTMSEDELAKDNFFSVDERNLPEAEPMPKGQSMMAKTMHSESGAIVEVQKISIFVQIYELLHRDIVNTGRDTTALLTRFGASIFLGLVIGVVYQGVGATDLSDAIDLQSHFGGITMVLIQAMFGTGISILLEFPAERPVFLREYTTDHYHIGAYIFAKFVMEAVLTFLKVMCEALILYYLMELQMPFLTYFGILYMLAMASAAIAVLLGSAMDDQKVAQESLPILYVPQFLFSGFFISTTLIPPYLRWAQYLCSLTYAIRLSVVNEFDNCVGPDAQQNCNDLFEELQVDRSDVWWYWLMITVIFLIPRIGAMFALKQSAKRFYSN